MSQAINQPSDCCTPCESPLVQNVPGPAGAAGAGGTNGTNGVNAFTDTTANYTQPAVGANVTISVGTSAWAVVGQEIVTESGGYYLVISKPTVASIAIQNRGYTANAAPGVVIASGSHVGPAGEKGTAGTNGSTANIPLTTKGDVFGYDSAPARIPVGTDGKVLAADSAQALGVNYVTVQPNTATDNAIARFDGTAGKPVPQQDSKVVITDDGALQASGSGGNARGARAVDLQVVRSLATQVASGAESVVAGGNSNLASGVSAAVSGGLTNIASGAQATVPGGSLNLASGDFSLSAGTGTIASGLSSAVFGTSNVASGNYSFVAGGIENHATGPSSGILAGNSALAELHGQVSHSSKSFGQRGDAQTSELMWSNLTTNATPTELFLNGSTLRATIRNYFSWVFVITIVGRNEATGNSAAWQVKGAINNTGGVPALVSAVATTLVAADAGSIAAGWGISGAVAVTADTVNDALKIAVTGAAATNIRWVAHARIVEVYFEP